ncbi:MAG TPA: hypothetical protein PKI66_06380 [Methanobacteriaceae archaeon]|nr:hypothetical protein [Methanobacteriaceae archaeon]
MGKENKTQTTPKRFMVSVENEIQYIRMLNHLERLYGLNMREFCEILIKYYWQDRTFSRPAIERILQKHINQEARDLEELLKPRPVVRGKMAFIG